MLIGIDFSFPPALTIYIYMSGNLDRNNEFAFRG